MLWCILHVNTWKSGFCSRTPTRSILCLQTWISLHHSFLSRFAGSARNPPCVHHRPLLLQVSPHESSLRCYTHISRVLPLQRPQHKLLHHHVKAKFLKPSTGGCRSPRPAAQRLTGLAPQGKPSCEETTPGNQGSTAGCEARGTLPPAPRSSADRTLASSSPPYPRCPPRSRARRRGRCGLTAARRPRGGAAPEGAGAPWRARPR